MSFNPYAPSQVQEEHLPEAPRSGGWRIEDGRLWAERDACLPMVDPYSGVRADRMTMMRLQVYRRVLWPRFAFLGGIGGSIGAALVGLPENVQVTFGIVGAVGFIAGLATPVLNRGMDLRVFVTHRTRLKQRFWGWTSAGVILFWFVSAFIAVIPPLLPAALLLGLLILRWVKRRIFYYQRAEETFEIGGLHPHAMAFLIQQAHAESHPR